MKSAPNFCQGKSYNLAEEHGESVLVNLNCKWLTTGKIYIQTPEYSSLYSDKNFAIGLEFKDTPGRLMKEEVYDTPGVHSFRMHEIRHMVTRTNNFNNSATLDLKKDRKEDKFSRWS